MKGRSKGGRKGQGGERSEGADERKGKVKGGGGKSDRLKKWRKTREDLEKKRGV